MQEQTSYHIKVLKVSLWELLWMFLFFHEPHGKMYSTVWYSFLNRCFLLVEDPTWKDVHVIPFWHWLLNTNSPARSKDLSHLIIERFGHLVDFPNLSGKAGGVLLVKWSFRMQCWNQ
jgi:hypothetical protein